MTFNTSRKKRWMLFWHSLVSAFFASALVAQAASPGKYITSDDFDLVKEMFSHRECDIPKFFEISKALGLASTWRQFDDLPDEAVGALVDLEPGSLCLIAMSSSFQAYSHKSPNKEGIVYAEKIGPKDVFPKGANVSELVFVLPKSLAPKKCVHFEGATAPYAITFEKKAGKLVRRIDALDAQEECFIAALKKTGAIPRNLPVSQK